VEQARIAPTEDPFRIGRFGRASGADHHRGGGGAFKYAVAADWRHDSHPGGNAGRPGGDADHFAHAVTRHDYGSADSHGDDYSGSADAQGSDYSGSADSHGGYHPGSAPAADERDGLLPEDQFGQLLSGWRILPRQGPLRDRGSRQW
jgi:hypothetical protein